jgi:hypothetical protein
VRAKFFPTMKSSFYWTSTATAASPTYTKNVGANAVSLEFTNGRTAYDGTDNLNLVRCVRTAQ